MNWREDSILVGRIATRRREMESLRVASARSGPWTRIDRDGAPLGAEETDMVVAFKTAPACDPVPSVSKSLSR